MRIAIVSDIHANLAAFEAVLEHAASRGYDKMICLGDVIGYGPDPVECIDLVRKHCEWSLLGNHDFAALYEPTNFNKSARLAAFWTRDEIKTNWIKRQVEAGASREALLAEQRLRDDFLFGISPRHILLDRYICVHASPSAPVNEYLFSEDIHPPARKLNRNFRLLELADSAGNKRPASALVGHTHCPGFLIEEPPDEVEREVLARQQAAREASGNAGGNGGESLTKSLMEDEAAERAKSLSFDFVAFERGMTEWSPTEREMPRGCRFILNPGSVGQPRDRDWRASYAILETGENGAPDRFTFYRVEYEKARTQARIQAFNIDGMGENSWLAARLDTGE